MTNRVRRYSRRKNVRKLLFFKAIRHEIARSLNRNCQDSTNYPRACSDRVRKWKAATRRNSPGNRGHSAGGHFPLRFFSTTVHRRGLTGVLACLQSSSTRLLMPPVFASLPSGVEGRFSEWKSRIQLAERVSLWSRKTSKFCPHCVLQ